MTLASKFTKEEIKEYVGFDLETDGYIIYYHYFFLEEDDEIIETSILVFDEEEFLDFIDLRNLKVKILEKQELVTMVKEVQNRLQENNDFYTE